MTLQTATQHTTNNPYTPKTQKDKTRTQQHTKQTNELDKRTTNTSHNINTRANKQHHTKSKEQRNEGAYKIQSHTGKAFKP